MKTTPSKAEVSLNNLTVNTVESNSGIFIGATNMSYGWSSHSKSNNGFGSFFNTKVTNSFCVIYDNDSIDAPIIDKKKFFVVKPKANPENADIHFADISVNGMSTNAAVSIGEVDQAGWSSHSKNNIGEGKNNGINTSAYNQVNIVDNDQMDAPIQNNISFGQNNEQTGE